MKMMRKTSSSTFYPEVEDIQEENSFDTLSSEMNVPTNESASKGTTGANRKKSVSFKSLQSTSINKNSAAKLPLSTTLPKTDALRDAIKDTSVVIPGSRKQLKEELLVKASKLKKLHTFSIPVEYWQTYSKRWTTDATLTVSKSKTKLHLDFNATSQTEPSSSNIGFNTNQQQNRVTFFFYNLVLEHSDPLALNFLAILSGGGQILRHRIAFYCEADGNFATVLFKKFGAQIIVRNIVPPPSFQINSFGSQPWKKQQIFHHEDERDLINERLSRQRKSIALGEDLNNRNPTQHEDKAETEMIFRRQSTGSYMDYAGGGSPLPDGQSSYPRKQYIAHRTRSTRWEDPTANCQKQFHKTATFQRKNSMNSQLRRSFSRSNSSGMVSPVMKNNKDEVLITEKRYTTSTSASRDTQKTTMQIKNNKKYSDQSLNSHDSDEYYDEEELQGASQKDSTENSSGEEDHFFMPSSMTPNENIDSVDGNFLKKVPTHRFFSRLVEATSSFSNSTPSLPSMVKRSSHLNNSKNNKQHLTPNKNPRKGDVKLQAAKFYLSDDKVIVVGEESGKNEDDNFNNNLNDLCDCMDENDDLGMKYEPSKMFGLINCEHKGFVGFEFDDYPEDVLFDMGKPPSFAPDGLENLSEEENEDEGKVSTRNEYIKERDVDIVFVNDSAQNAKVDDSSFIPMNTSHEDSNTSSRNSTLSSCNWIRRSFEDLDIEAVQTETMQIRKRKDSKMQQPKHQQLERRKLTSSTSVDFHNDISSKDVPYGDTNADYDCVERSRIVVGHVIDDDSQRERVIPKDIQRYPCQCPIEEILYCDSCCYTYPDNIDYHQSQITQKDKGIQNQRLQEHVSGGIIPDEEGNYIKVSDSINDNKYLREHWAPRDNEPKLHQSSKGESKLSETSSEAHVNLASSSASFIDSETSKKDFSTDLAIPLLKNASLDHYTSHYGSNSYSTNL